jgi:TolA-binding protein
VTTVIEMHPEELFDKLSLGALSQHENERLRAHLATCAVCRFELDARGDFDGEFQSILAPNPARGAASLPLRRRNRLRRAAIWTLAAAALFVATGALAAAVTGKTPWELVTSVATPEVDDAGDASHTSAKRKAAPAAVTVVAPVAPAQAELASASSAAVATGLSGSARVGQVPKARDTVAPATASERVATSATPRHTTAEPMTASALFADANRARTSGDAAEAIQLYRRLQRRFPRSREAELSQLTLARLLLDSGDARSALGGFDAYLGQSGRALQAEALVGRALSLRALGRRDAEIAAWRDVLARHPRSVYARQASERLAALSRL